MDDVASLQSDDLVLTSSDEDSETESEEDSESSVDDEELFSVASLASVDGMDGVTSGVAACGVAACGVAAEGASSTCCEAAMALRSRTACLLRCADRERNSRGHVQREVTRSHATSQREVTSQPHTWAPRVGSTYAESMFRKSLRENSWS